MTHPYISGGGSLVQAVTQFRKTLPSQVSADTFRKLGIAPNNETYLINILKFIGMLADDGQVTPEAKKVFVSHENDEFSSGFSEMVKAAYSELFGLHGDAAWKLPSTKLVGFFRRTDGTSEVVGKRQASTFQTLAALSGFANVPAPKTNTTKTEGKKATPTIRSQATVKTKVAGLNGNEEQEKARRRGEDFGLTVRIEVNLPAGGDKDTYDAIFKSIRENLLSGN